MERATHGRTQEELDDEVEFVVLATLFAAGQISILAGAIERGDELLGVDPVAWDNTMAATEWAMKEQLRGRIQGPTTITAEDVDRLNRLRGVGAAALAGEPAGAELLAIARRCIDTLLGPGNTQSLDQAVEAVRQLNQMEPPSIRQ